jgi:hypothetical protein
LRWRAAVSRLRSEVSVARWLTGIAPGSRLRELRSLRTCSRMSGWV